MEENRGDEEEGEGRDGVEEEERGKNADEGRLDENEPSCHGGKLTEDQLSQETTRIGEGENIRSNIPE